MAAKPPPTATTKVAQVRMALMNRRGLLTGKASRGVLQTSLDMGASRALHTWCIGRACVDMLAAGAAAVAGLGCSGAGTSRTSEPKGSGLEVGAAAVAGLCCSGAGMGRGSTGGPADGAAVLGLSWSGVAGPRGVAGRSSNVLGLC